MKENSKALCPWARDQLLVGKREIPDIRYVVVSPETNILEL